MIVESQTYVNNTWGEDLGDQRTSEESRERGLFGGLDDDTVSSSERGSELPGEPMQATPRSVIGRGGQEKCGEGKDIHENGEVPGNDLSNNSDWLVTGVDELGVIDLNDLVVQ